MLIADLLDRLLEGTTLERELPSVYTPLMLSAHEAYELINCADHEMESLLTEAGALRDQMKGKTVTYSRKVFLPVTNLCRDRCSYCTFRKDPDDPDAWT